MGPIYAQRGMKMDDLQKTVAKAIANVSGDYTKREYHAGLLSPTATKVRAQAKAAIEAYEQFSPISEKDLNK